jgi:putative ABC transport system ATP-binding protein
MKTLMIRVRNLSKTYLSGELEVKALKGVSLDIAKGEFVAVMGSSGSGKSTLMSILGLLDTPTSGCYWLNGEDVSSLSKKEQAKARNRRIGFVFQSFNLLPRLDAYENVELPLIYAGMPAKRRKRLAQEALEWVGLEDRMRHKPSELSGGQQQRVAIARAIAGGPSVILADEPTGNLDEESGSEMLAIFRELNRQGATIVMVTHESAIARKSGRIIRIADGRQEFSEGFGYGFA